MALERNNPASGFDGGFDGEFNGEFDAMLRRHLKQGGSPVAACNGFDADLASAYLENALGKHSRADFEQHLSACAPCRGHLVALSRLMPAPAPASMPVREAVAEGRSRWREFREWLAAVLDPGAWRLDWQTMGLAGAAAAILLLALVAQPWRRDDPAGSTVAVTSVPAPAAPAVADAIPSPTVDNPEAALVAGASDAAKTQIPRPEVTPQPGADPTSNEIDASSNRLALQPAAPAAAPPTLPSASLESVRELPQTFAAPPVQAPAPNFAGSIDLAQDEPSRLGPSPEDNPMRTISTSAAKRRERQAERAPAAAKPNWIDRAMAFAPTRKSTDKAAAPPATQSAEDENARYLIVRVHNRVFRRENGTWIDQEYKPEMQWRLTKLVYGSPEFQRILEQEPQLKPYFDKRSIIVVWRDKIYKVTEK